MAKDIEEFLRQAAQRRLNPGGVAPVEQPVVQPPFSTPRTVATGRPWVLADTDEVEIIEAEPVDPSWDSDGGGHSVGGVGQHVSRHIDVTDVYEHGAPVGEAIDRQSNDSETRLRNKFDRDVGHLHDDHIADAGELSAQETKTQRADRTSEAADELVEMLRSPKSFRQAIILNEILRRPRWDD